MAEIVNDYLTKDGEALTLKDARTGEMHHFPEYTIYGARFNGKAHEIFDEYANRTVIYAPDDVGIAERNAQYLEIQALATMYVNGIGVSPRFDGAKIGANITHFIPNDDSETSTNPIRKIAEPQLKEQRYKKISATPASVITQIIGFFLFLVAPVIIGFALEDFLLAISSILIGGIVIAIGAGMNTDTAQLEAEYSTLYGLYRPYFHEQNVFEGRTLLKAGKWNETSVTYPAFAVTQTFSAVTIEDTRRVRYFRNDDIKDVNMIGSRVVITTNDGSVTDFEAATWAIPKIVDQFTRMAQHNANAKKPKETPASKEKTVEINQRPSPTDKNDDLFN